MHGDRQALNSAADSAEASKDKTLEETTNDVSTSVAGRAQGIVMDVGKGCLAVVGEAGMFSAQIAKIADGDRTRKFKMGMNVQGYDNQKFALNLMHGLSRFL